MRQQGEQPLDVVAFNRSPGPSFISPPFASAHGPCPVPLPSSLRPRALRRSEGRAPNSATPARGPPPPGSRELRMRRHFAEELAQRARRRAAHRSPAGTSFMTPACAAICAPAPILIWPAEPAWPPSATKSPITRRAGDAALPDHHAMAADRRRCGRSARGCRSWSLADDRVAVGAAVDRRFGADLDVVLDDHAADLRHFEMAARPHRETKTVLADVRAGMDDHTIADQRAERWSTARRSTLSRPIRTSGPITALAPMRVPAPISAPGRSPRRGRRSTPGSSRAAEWTKAARRNADLAENRARPHRLRVKPRHRLRPSRDRVARRSARRSRPAPARRSAARQHRGGAGRLEMRRDSADCRGRRGRPARPRRAAATSRTIRPAIGAVAERRAGPLRDLAERRRGRSGKKPIFASRSFFAGGL